MDDITGMYEPTHQLVIYNGSSNNAYVEHYEIIKSGSKKVLSEGKPLTKKALRQLLEMVVVSDTQVISNINQLMPDNVLFFDNRIGKSKLIWWSKAQERELIGINKNKVKAKLPAFLYELEDDSLSIYAIKTNKRPDLKTPLFHAPLPNVYENAKVCMGDVKKPKNKTELVEVIAAWEQAFWGSKFGDYLWDIETYDKKLRSCIRKKIAYPAKELKPTKKTVNTLLK